MEFLIVTGLSGAGKSSVVNILEDIDFYCIDNIPPSFIDTFYDLAVKSNDNSMNRMAVVTDIRAGKIVELHKALQKLKDNKKPYKILFLDAQNAVIEKRFIENRRRHPLSKKNPGSILKAIELERESMRIIRADANYLIDTSLLSSAQLKTRVTDMFMSNSSMALSINCLSFGFKYGIPSEASLVFDVRCLPNPYYDDKLKDLNGLDSPVRDYVLESVQTKGFVDKLYSFIDYMLPLYVSEGKSQLFIAIGCTGGKHRSVALTQLLYDHLTYMKDYKVIVQHRDINKN